MVRFLTTAATLGSLVLASAITPVHAQTVAKPFKPISGQSTTRSREPSEQPPSAVPGARAEPSNVAPAERIPSDMPPTEALFDAINRGDTVTAREAIGRGADIHGRNVLGLTPLEQSVDLGRNDISFLLLSLRGGAGYNTASGPVGRTGPEEKLTPAQARAERRAATLEATRVRREQMAEAQTHSAPPAPARNARLFAGDGGAPVPQAGFLGFDSAR